MEEKKIQSEEALQNAVGGYWRSERIDQGIEYVFTSDEDKEAVKTYPLDTVKKTRGPIAQG